MWISLLSPFFNFHNCKEFLDNTYFVETPSAIPEGCPRNLRGAATDFVTGEDRVEREKRERKRGSSAWWAIEKVKQRLPDVNPAQQPHVSWFLNSCARCESGRQKEREHLTPCLLQVRKKTLRPIDHGAIAKRWRVTLFGFPRKRKSSVPGDITQESPFLTDGNHGAVKIQLSCLVSIKALNIKDDHSHLMRIFCTLLVYFDGKLWVE